MPSVRYLFSIATVWALASCSSEAGFVLTGDHVLAPNQSGQVISIFASPTLAGEIAAGFNLNFVVDDGGSIAGGLDNNAPKIQSINLKPAGGLFAGIPDTQTNVFLSQKLYQVTIAPTSVSDRPVILDNILLAQVTLDTSGLETGSWALDLDGLPAVGLPSSDFAGATTTVINGTISVPEPENLFLLVLAGCVAPRLRARRIG